MILVTYGCNLKVFNLQYLCDYEKKSLSLGQDVNIVSDGFAILKYSKRK